MDANEYQRLAGRTLIDTPDVELTEYHAFTTHDTVHQCAEVGKIADYVKKGIFHKHGFSADTYEDLQCEAGASIDDTAYPLTDAETFAAWNVLGLCGEAGEVAALVDAMIAGRQPLDTAALRKELGDVLWYVAALATKAGLEMGDIMQANIDKLRTRYPEGYTAEASAARVDTKSLQNRYLESVASAPTAHTRCEAQWADVHYISDGEYTLCDLDCGAAICAACADKGYTTCANCCCDGEEDASC